MSNVLLEVVDLKKYYKTPKGMLHAVDGVSFSIEKGKTLGIVGESGCGKTTVGRTLLRLVKATSGKVIYDGIDIFTASPSQFRKLRQDMQIVFQDPFSSLNPRKTVSQTLDEALRLTKEYKNHSDREVRILELMETVGIEPRIYNAYPHELDGGRRQRVGIARALAVNPSFIVCDEPVSTLDVSIQAQVLNLMKDVQEKMGLTYIFISHDLSVVKHISDEIMVMYMGRVVEKAPADVLFERPMHPYTRALLSAIPEPRLDNRRERILLEGEITSPINPKPICRFANRCMYVTDRCRQEDVSLIEMEPGHLVACHCPCLDN